MDLTEITITGFILMIGMFIERQIGATKTGRGIIALAVILVLYFTINEQI